MPTHKSEDFKISAVNYYLDSNKIQEEVCDIFKLFYHRILSNLYLC